jgi:hypothetical protein
MDPIAPGYVRGPFGLYRHLTSPRSQEWSSRLCVIITSPSLGTDDDELSIDRAAIGGCRMQQRVQLAQPRKLCVGHATRAHLFEQIPTDVWLEDDDASAKIGT